MRIAYLIAEKQVPPHNILAVTFTNKAAGEMRARVTELLKGERLNSAPLISTFHSLCVRILRQDIDKLDEGYKKTFTIYDTDDSQKVVKACIKDLGLDEKQIVPRIGPQRDQLGQEPRRGRRDVCLACRIRRRKERPRSPRFFKMYDERLNTANALDFDDLLIKTVKAAPRNRPRRARNITTGTSTSSLTNIRTQMRCSLR